VKNWFQNLAFKFNLRRYTMVQNLDAEQIISQIFDTQVTHASNAWHRGKLDQCHNLLGGTPQQNTFPAKK
jgi:hypothetical protein